MRLLKLFALVATLAAAVTIAGAARADDGPSWGPESPHFNLEAVLRATGDDGFGLVKFRQPNDGSKVIYLDTWVRDLLPNTTYYLRRAVDTSVDDNCTGSNWLTLGSITTDEGGTGRAALSRDVTLVPTGREFDISFIIVDAPNSTTPILASGCYQYTVDGD